MGHTSPSLSSKFIEKLPTELIQILHSTKETVVSQTQPPEILALLSEEEQAKTLVFVTKPHDLVLALNSEVPMLVAHQDLKAQLQNLNLENQGKNIYLTPSISIAMSFILPQLKNKDCDWGTDIHPTAVIHPSAVIDPHTKIGPHCVIEERAHIKAGVHLLAHVFVGAQAFIGENTKLHSGVHIGERCKVGNNCEIQANSTIGSDGFGYATLPNKTHRKIPQLGVVIIEDDVEIGANCAIDRATLTETRIRKGVKFDNLCHVAHNCEIGENSRLAAGFMSAGSTKVGKNFLAAGSVVLNDHIEITDDVTLAGRSAATGDITETGVYGGYPPIPYKDFVKYLSSQSSLPELRKKISRIMKHLNLD